MNKILIAAGAMLLFAGWLALSPTDATPVAPPVVIDEAFALGRYALIVYEADEKAAYPASQSLILDSAEFKQYLNTTATDGWRILDQNASTEFMPLVFQKWLARPRDNLPWLMVSNGTSGTEGELPLAIAAAKKVIGELLQ